MAELSAAELTTRIAPIELLVLDVDGVLTDGRIIYADDGQEIKAFHVRDGAAIKWWREAGKRVAIISGRSSPAVRQRARELAIDAVIQGVSGKLSALRSLLTGMELRPEQVCAVGDDLPDLPVMKNVGLAVAVADASPQVRQDAHMVTTAAGGRGAVREVIEVLLGGQGVWQAIVDRYRLARL
jgi:3-deoxy-D-manno-octulosonate 8-phosphate phosphatase (KDO 8-P phosphatase)